MEVHFHFRAALTAAGIDQGKLRREGSERGDQRDEDGEDGSHRSWEFDFKIGLTRASIFLLKSHYTTFNSQPRISRMAAPALTCSSAKTIALKINGNRQRRLVSKPYD